MSNGWRFNYCLVHGLGVIYMLHFQKINFIKALAYISFNVGSCQVFSVQMLTFFFYDKRGSPVVVDKLLILQECYDECSF